MGKPRVRGVSRPGCNRRAWEEKEVLLIACRREGLRAEGVIAGRDKLEKEGEEEEKTNAGQSETKKTKGKKGQLRLVMIWTKWQEMIRCKGAFLRKPTIPTGLKVAPGLSANVRNMDSNRKDKLK